MIQYMTKEHDHICDIRQLAGSTQWMALDDNGYMDADIRVTSCGEGVFILESHMFRTFWQSHSEDCSFHSGLLSDMTDKAQTLIIKKMREVAHVG